MFIASLLTPCPPPILADGDLLPWIITLGIDFTNRLIAGDTGTWVMVISLLFAVVCWKLLRSIRE